MDEWTCMICYEPPKGENFKTSKCGHMACETCWGTWLSTKLECPMCKKRVKKNQLIKLHKN